MESPNGYKMHKVRTSAIVGTTAMVAGTVVENPKFEDEIILLVDFTKGSLTNVSLMIEFSPDGTNYYQETGVAYSAGVNTIKALTHLLDATGKFRLAPIKIKDRYIKVSAQGSGNNAGSLLKIDAIIGQDI